MSSRPAFIGLALAGIIAARWAASVATVADPVTVGAWFGAGLLAIWLVADRLVGGARSWAVLARPHPQSIVVGLAAGGVLIGVALTTRAGSPIAIAAPAAAFWPWAAVTVLVATTEELVLRGALFTAIATDLGLVAAVVATSVVFALMHVPLYGWQVVPLDLGVGLLFGGLRLLTGGVTAPAIAHVLADLATWWL